MMQTVSITRPRRNKIDRRTQILQVLAQLLENPRGEKITTALIAQKLELSEASLYRNFVSKAAMFDGLLDFIEQSLLSLFTQIRDQQDMSPTAKVQAMINVMLDFAKANPGMTRVLTGLALVYEHERLQERVNRILDVLETNIRQTYKLAMVAGEFPADFNAKGRANLVMCFVMGRWTRYVTTGFKSLPNEGGPVTFAPFLCA